MDQNQINGYEMDFKAFHDRFKSIDNITDPFGRIYFVCEDDITKNRVVCKSYATQNKDQQQTVFDNLQNYHKLSEKQGFSKLMAYAKSSTETICAFQYNDMTIIEFSKTDQFTRDRVEFYVLLLAQLTQITKSMSQIGLDVDQLSYTNILVYSEKINNHTRRRIKILYDERQKFYDKIIEGIKVFNSKEKLQSVINEIDQLNPLDGEEAIYQIGLMLIDLMFQCQITNLSKSQNQIFVRDHPVMTSRLCNNMEQSYYSFLDGQVQRKQQMISQKVKCNQFFNNSVLLNNKDHSVKQLTQLSVKMIGPVDSRISFQQLEGQSDRIQKIFKDSRKKIVRISPDIKTDKISRQKTQVLSSCENIKSVQNLQEQRGIIKQISQKNIITQKKKFLTQQEVPYKKQEIITETSTKNFQFQIGRQFLRQNQTVNSRKQISSTNIPSSGLTNPFLSQAIHNMKIVIPRQSILQNVKAHQSLKNSLQNLIKKLQQLQGVNKKIYFDNSTYYGQINEVNNKRNGEGIYIYTSGQTSGDIYFGNWRDNILTSGTYLFKNGQSYQGSVKNGKQGWGKYRYNNGNVYEGQWRDDIKNGNGTMNYPNGDRYQGVWKNGKKNGLGKYFYNNGTVYEGNFTNGKKNGFGSIFFTNGTRIQANWQQTHIQGNGKVHYPNGDYFQGNYHMSQKHGKGLYFWASQKCKYEGDFRKDLLEGEAKLHFSDRQFYFGKIKNGKRDGQGIYNYQNGDKFQGEWKNDLKLIGCYKFQNGDQFQGRFKDNQLNFGVMRYSNGQIYEGQFKDGFRNGVGSYHSSTGTLLYQGHWKHDNFIQQ